MALLTSNRSLSCFLGWYFAAFFLNYPNLSGGGVEAFVSSSTTPTTRHPFNTKPCCPARTFSQGLKASSNLELDTVLQDIQSIDDLMQTYDPILLFARRLLPEQTAKDASALYAWCRRLDEITDDPNADVETIQQRLDIWQRRFEKICNNEPVDDMDAALTECLSRSESLTKEPFEDMIQGMRNDAVLNRRIKTMDELEEYAYQVAGTVGVMLLPLLKADMKNAKEPAIALGKAIQLINILRDASFDVSLGRIYLPQELLNEYHVLEEDIMNYKSSKEYCAVVKHVADRATDLLEQAEEGKKSLPGLGPLFVQIIIELYREYLEKLESFGYDNLNTKGERVRISSLQKLGSVVKAVGKII
ncbi:hypothetical protein CTEN210_08988 [Chaetoceros tenuissimus]|uniref:15-cis-phytoene synthase n=1 Tax=Chaetoceros tenuissimus TaxID=426638 RepID=A0AAD3CUK9_9STRA|nr:hypothetical protein CTEN210_08988 [Chaetoceros tenuissimus]